MLENRYPEALSGMLRSGSPSPGLYAALGPDLLPSWFLAALCPSLAAGTGVFWLDAGNSFNAYSAGYAARALGKDPLELLSRVRLARPFNLYQLETMVREKLPASWRGEPVVLSDPLPMIGDPDAPEADRCRVGAAVLEAMRSLPAVWLVLLVERRGGDGSAWLESLLRRASGAAVLKPYGPLWRLERLRPAGTPGAAAIPAASLARPYRQEAGYAI